MLKYGTISERKAAEARVRVNFEEDGIVSDWLPIVVSAGAKNSFFALPDVGEQVACIMDERCENGVVVGAIYSNDTKPKQSGDDITSVEFEDGTKVIYDRSAKTLTIDAQGEISITAKGNITVKSDKDVKVECVNAVVKATTKTTLDTPNAEFTGNVKIDGNVNIAGGGTITGNIVGQSDFMLVGGILTGDAIISGADIRAGSGTVGLLTHTHIQTAIPGTPTATGLG